jgi:hypothetical protein
MKRAGLVTFFIAVHLLILASGWQASCGYLSRWDMVYAPDSEMFKMGMALVDQICWVLVAPVLALSLVVEWAWERASGRTARRAA